MRQQEWSKTKLKLLEEDEKRNKMEKPFVKKTMERIKNKSEEEMKRMDNTNVKFGRRANGEEIPSDEEETPPAEGLVENPFFEGGNDDEALEKIEKEENDKWASMLLRGAKAQLRREGRTAFRSNEFQRLLDQINFTRASTL